MQRPNAGESRGGHGRPCPYFGPHKSSFHLPIFLQEIPISFSDLPISLEEIHKSARKIHISLSEIHISSEETSWLKARLRAFRHRLDGRADDSPSPKLAQFKRNSRSPLAKRGATALKLSAPSRKGRPKCGSSSVGRASPCQGEGREFESRLPLFFVLAPESAPRTFRERGVFCGRNAPAPSGQGALSGAKTILLRTRHATCWHSTF